MSVANWKKDLLLIFVGAFLLGAILAFPTATGGIHVSERLPIQPHLKRDIESAAVRLDALVADDTDYSALNCVGRADALKIARRLALALTGTLPSVEELRRFERVHAEDRVDWYVTYLLNDHRSSEYLAERLARVTVGVEEGPFLIYRRRRFVSWLAEQIHDNRPYDHLVHEILTGSGLWTDSPAVNFYTYNIVGDDEANQRPDPIRMAARTSRAFLGMRIDCLQCHDDFLGTMNLGSPADPVAGNQRHFHALASFFSQVENSLIGIADDLESETYRYQLLDADEIEPILPEVPFNQELDDASQPNLRVRFANWTTDPDNRPFARAIVNRMWAIMFGRGMIQPVDDIPLAGPFPPQLEWLADDFVDHGFNLHRLIRLIAMTALFQRESGTLSQSSASELQAGESYPLTRLRPEQVAGAIIQSTSLRTINSTSHVVSRLIKFGQQNDFVKRYGDPGEEEFRTRSETITQRLLLLNGEMVRERLEDGLYSPSRIAALSPSPEKAVEIVYLAVLTRRPTPEEARHFVAKLESFDESSRQDIISDLYWTLINSVEFAWNH